MSDTEVSREELRRRVALFRHAIIGDLDVEELPRGEISARIVELASRTYRKPDGGEARFSVRTLWSWWSAYRKAGLEGLMPKGRSDADKPRALDAALIEEGIRLRKEVPRRSTKTLIDILERSGNAPRGKLRRSTLDRHLAVRGASRRQLKTLGDKRYIRLLFRRPNQLWVGDYHEAPILWNPEAGRFRTIHLSAFLDHYSKVVPHAEWYTNEKVATLEDTFKKAVLRRGLPGAVYVDNALIYRGGDFAFACDRLDIKVRHSLPYQSEGRGAIERFNRTVTDQFEPEILAHRIAELGEINLRFEAWLEERYHLETHEGTGEVPVDRFAQGGFTPRYPDPVVLCETFRVRVRRKVHPKTSTVEVEGVPFLVESWLRGRRVEVHYDPHLLADVLVYLGGKRIQRALPQQPNEHPLPRPERSVASEPVFDYLGALRAEYDRRIVAEARRLSYSDLKPGGSFSLRAFLDLAAQYLGKELSPYEKDELEKAHHAVGPFSESTARLALEHATRIRGRGLHISVYTHYLKVFQLAALHANSQDREETP